MSETHQERAERLIDERDAAIHQLAEWFVRTGGEVSDASLHHGNRFCFPYTIHELLDKAISDLRAKEEPCQRTT